MSTCLKLKKRRVIKIETCLACPNSKAIERVAVVAFSCREIGGLFDIVKRGRHPSLVAIEAEQQGIHKDCPLEQVE